MDSRHAGNPSRDHQPTNQDALLSGVEPAARKRPSGPGESKSSEASAAVAAAVRTLARRMEYDVHDYIIDIGDQESLEELDIQVETGYFLDKAGRMVERKIRSKRARTSQSDAFSNSIPINEIMSNQLRVEAICQGHLAHDGVVTLQGRFVCLILFGSSLTLSSICSIHR